jgi:hypothetical protein
MILNAVDGQEMVHVSSWDLKLGLYLCSLMMGHTLIMLRQESSSFIFVIM